MGRDLFGKPLSPKTFTVRFITIAKLQFGSRNKDNFMIWVSAALGRLRATDSDQLTETYFSAVDHLNYKVGSCG